MRTLFISLIVGSVILLGLSCSQENDFDVNLEGEWHSDYPKLPTFSFRDSFMVASTGGDSIRMYQFERKSDSLIYWLGNTKFHSPISELSGTKFIIHGFQNERDVTLTRIVR